MNPSCNYCLKEVSIAGSRLAAVVSHGSFLRTSDGRVLKRYRCLSCKKTFSEASYDPRYRQRKRQVNGHIFEQLVSSVSQRRTAKLLRINRKTVVRKFIFLGVHAELFLNEMNLKFKPAVKVQFDDLETFEHSKCKPLSVIMAVEEKTRRILGFKVARMPTKGLLAAIARKRYGKRPDERGRKRDQLFKELTSLVHERAHFKSDMHQSYPGAVKKHFPKATHETFKSRSACVVGQGELKAGGRDPLFTLNHTFAMTRANINRLVRKTWCTTKLPERLHYHFALYALYHNLALIPGPAEGALT